jgi:uncharacterized membrane protein
VTIKEAADAGPLGMAVGALVGGFVGLIGGPVGVVAGATSGALFGGMTDLISYGIGDDFAQKAMTILAPGKSAIIAEVAEGWTTPLDTRMEALGGTVLRTWRVDFEDEQIAAAAALHKADVEELRAEYAQASAEAKAKVKAKLDQAKANLEQAEKRLKDRLTAIEVETKAKIAALEQQAASAKADAKEKIKQRIAATRADFEARSAKLKQAWTLTKEAFAA